MKACARYSQWSAGFEVLVQERWVVRIDLPACLTEGTRRTGLTNADKGWCIDHPLGEQFALLIGNMHSASLQALVGVPHGPRVYLVIRIYID